MLGIVRIGVHFSVTGCRITWEGASGQPVENCLDDFNRYGQNCLNCG